MGFVEWAAKMRKKPLEERRSFVISATLFIMVFVVAVWGVFFFSGISKQIDENRAYSDEKNSIPMTFNEEKPVTLPLPEF